MAGLLDFLSLRDMIDGGGAGAAGSEFKGGGYSEFLNALGVRPMGQMSQGNLAAARPMARPAGMTPMAQPMPPASPGMAPPPNPYGAGAVTTTALPPMGQMPNEELIRLLLSALNGNQATGYGPR